MAAPMRQVALKSYVQYRAHVCKTHSLLCTRRGNGENIIKCTISNYAKYGIGNTNRNMPIKALLGLTAAAGLTAYVSNLWQRAKPVLHASATGRPYHPPIRSMRHKSDNTGLKLTLYQYQTCPFCCKVRAFLDYHGFSYDVVEVNSVWRTQTKWSKYKKVPILVCDGCGPDGFVQLNDSSVIISCLETFLRDRSLSMDQIVTYYPTLESKEKGKTVYEHPNKYFIMYGEQALETTPEARKEERKWRSWTDGNLVHMLSPNIYRSSSEALAAFNYFSEVGDWEKVFSTPERYTVIYLGAAAMLLVGKLLKKKYNLKPDVRESLYDSCREWTKAVGKNRKFMGGDQPNLADLAVFGTLSSIEGCQAFKDTIENTNIEPWYQLTKAAVTSHAGSHPVKMHT